MKKTSLVRIIFEPDGTDVFVPVGTLLSKASAAAGITVETPCGGMGTCGKCKVIVTGAVQIADASERRLLSDDEMSCGVRLACRTRVVGETTVSVPDSSRSIVQKILCQGVIRECEVLSAITKVYCELSPPSFDDETCEFERLAKALAARDIKLEPNLHVMQNMSRVMRAADYRVTAVIMGDELISIEPGDTTAHTYGIAYDLGSTTVVGYLMDLISGKQLAVSAVMNPQMVYGDDLVSRISFATTHDDGAKILQSAAVDALNRIAEAMTETAGVCRDNIYKATVVGNTCMTHLLLGIDTTSLGQSPFVPTLCKDITVSARELSLNIAPEAKVIVLPNVAGFVGSDLVGVLLSSMWEQDGQTRLAVDIGTNGEMALLHKGKTYACSAAAGPAFEGAGISCGMRGGAGAIDSVKIDDSVKISTIDNRKPLGICGSGIIDAIAEMLEAGIIDDTGRFITSECAAQLPPAVRKRLFLTDSGGELVLADKKESGTGKPITITASDVRRLQLAKGSIHAAIQTLVRTAGASDSELDEILLAGAFGNYIRVESAIRIGLIPLIAREKVVSIGNAAGAGSRLALLSEREMEMARKLASEAEHVELASSPDYQMELMERMMFPPSLTA